MVTKANNTVLDLENPSIDGINMGGNVITNHGSPIAPTDVPNKAYVDLVVVGGAIIGEVRMWTTGVSPSGWHFCNGQAINRVTFANLFAVIGTTYGIGNGSTTFNIPDFDGRMPAGVGTSSASDGKTWTLGEKPNTGAGGEGQHVLTILEMPSHSHFLTDLNTGSEFPVDTKNTIVDHVPANDDFETSETGGGNAHNITPPGLGINFILFGPN